MTQIQQYHHHDQAGLYIGSTPVDFDPRDAELVMPPPFGATLTPPPACAEHEAAKLQDGVWVLVPDWRGFTYWTADGAERTVTEVGVELPAGALTERPLAKVKDSKSLELRQATAQAIVSGFSSDALGTTHQYPSKETDQMNLNGSVTASMLKADVNGWTTPFWCASQEGEWAWRPHSAAQIQKVGEDAISAILMWQGKNAALQAQVAAANTTEEVNAITFE